MAFFPEVQGLTQTPGDISEEVGTPYIGNVIIPTDFHSMIFQRGRYTTNQPDMVLSYDISYIYDTQLMELNLLMVHWQFF